MTKEEMMTLLRDPGQTGQAVDELNCLIEKNPYFHTGHQLYIKSLQQTDETKMTLQLQKTALNVRDRSVLYNYLNQPSAFRQEPLIQDEKHDEIKVPFVPGSSYISQQNDTYNVKTDEPSETFLPSSPPSTMEGEWQSEENQVLVEVKNMSTEQLEEMLRQQIQQIQQIGSTPTTEIIQQTSITETDNKLILQENTSDDLIDSFLMENPKIIPGNSQFQADLSAGMDENNDISTETLADIYASQGLKDKAIEIYQQLILKNPKKKTYFAAQIDRL